MDLIEDEAAESLLAQASRRERVFLVSALRGAGIPELLSAASEALRGELTEAKLFLPYSDGRARAWLHGEGVVANEKQINEGFSLTVRWSARQANSFAGIASAKTQIS